MAEPNPSENEKVFAKFFGENWTLIVDSVSGSRTRLAASLAAMGAKRNRMSLVGTLDEAKAEMKEKKPRIVICDYQLGPHSGLDLLQEQRAQFPESKDCLFILVTGNTSQSAVARAAEEDVDAFILKPYTVDSFKRSILQAAIAKIRPTPYIVKIEEGKKLLFEGNTEGAIQVFTAAAELDPKPSLAMFYRGQAELLKKAVEAAQENYQGGLSHQKIHYKCLIGLFDILQNQKKHEEAYDIVRKVVQYFPANPRRLASVLRLAIVTQNYADVEGFYRIFTNLDSRDDELVKYVCSALSVTGKYYLRTKVNTRAFELFEKVGITAAGRVNFLVYIIETLVEYGFSKEAEKTLDRFPAEIREQNDYLVCHFMVKDSQVKAIDSAETGRSLIAKGIRDPRVNLLLIPRYIEIGKRDYAEELVTHSCELWPKRAEEFKELLTKVEKRS